MCTHARSLTGFLPAESHIEKNNKKQHKIKNNTLTYVGLNDIIKLKQNKNH